MNSPRMTIDEFQDLQHLTKSRGISYVGAKRVLCEGLSYRQAAAHLPCNHQAIAQAVRRLLAAQHDAGTCPYCGHLISSPLAQKKLTMESEESSV